MTWLQKRVVTFRLSSLGKQELQGIFEETSFSAFIADTDETGAWLIFDNDSNRETAPSFLLKWEYIAVASVEVSLKNEESEVVKRTIGFQQKY